MDYFKGNITKNATFLGGVQPDFNNVGVAGHSRGGKLSTLVFTDYKGHYGVKAAFLVDPVDGKNHRAINQLKTKSTPVGMISLNKIGAWWQPKCSPQGRNAQDYYKASAKGSTLFEILDAGHMQILENVEECQTGKKLCPNGKDQDQVVQQLVLPPIVSWFRQTLYGDDPSKNKDFLEFVDEKKKQGLIKYQEKSQKASVTDLSFENKLQIQ